MLLTPYDLEGFERGGLRGGWHRQDRVLDGSQVVMEPGKSPYCVAKKCQE